jgi:iron complex transport system substrate-binding protein
MKSSSQIAKSFVVCVLLCMLLAACGANSSVETASSAVQAATGSGQASSSTTPETRVFRDYQGHEVTIPTHPKRIIVNQFMGHLLAVGVKPVGASSNQLSQFEKSSFLKPLGLTTGIEDLGTTISLEKALSMEPDLIILQENANEETQNYAAFSKIAPTVILKYGSKTMLDQLKEVANVAGQPQKAEQWIAQYEKKVMQYREQLAGVIGSNLTFTVMEAWPKSEIMIFGNLFGRGTFSLYNSLQLKAPPKVQEAIMDKEPSYVKVSLEALPEYMGDYVFLSVYDWQNGDNSKLENELKNAPVWRSLSVVKENRVIPVSVDDFLPGDPLSIEKQMEKQVQLLLEHYKK